MHAAALQADVARNHEYPDQDLRVAHSSAVSATAYMVPSSSDAQVSAVFFQPQAPGRPEARDFFATGPLAPRLMEPTFGPAARPSDLFIPDPPARLESASDLLCIAVAVYHEARGQTLDGQLAVASVILNRTREPERWGATPCAVVEPVQFSFLGEDGSYPAIPKDESWAIAVEMARGALERGPSALVGQADHYHTPAVNPDWSEHMEQVVRIQNHIFFADLDVKG
jgi:spore germination cell wall hydrolase CwlJ-like protein